MLDSREKGAGIRDRDIATYFHSSPPTTHKQNQTFISVIYTDIRSQLKPYCEISPLYPPPPPPPDMMGRSHNDERIVEGGAACNL